MIRRSFIKGLLTAPLALKLGSGHPGQEAPQELTMNRFSVAGFQYYQGPGIINRIKAGEALELKQEPQNRYDEFAVRIFHGSRMIGYVPRSDNRHISRLLGQNASLRCRAVRIRPQAAPWKALKVEVSVLI